MQLGHHMVSCSTELQRHIYRSTQLQKVPPETGLQDTGHYTVVLVLYNIGCWVRVAELCRVHFGVGLQNRVVGKFGICLHLERSHVN